MTLDASAAKCIVEACINAKEAMQMANKTYTVIFYRQYGKWSCTMPFETRDKAERHADMYLRNDEIRRVGTGELLLKNTREHITDITFKDVELPE